ncbi:unnamed protein product [Microthlaspi erraticum]|uniref:Uncharacterized protein n=1 Tax=Microthlaspi erraticum TaxID=1685480 RepID=A0A6D2KZZ2_9BRAS|nr:unnamed protein product [Microthlaspi erraticum]
MGRRRRPQPDSEISFGDEVDGDDFEPEPPDYGQGSTSHESWSSKEDYIEGYKEENHESKSQFSPEEGDHEIEAELEQLNHEDQFIELYHEEKPRCEETDSQISLEETEPNNEESGYQDDYAHESEDNNEAERWVEENLRRGDKEPAPLDQTSHYYTPKSKSNQGLGKEDKGLRLQTTTSTSKLTDLKSEIILNPSLDSLETGVRGVCSGWRAHDDQQVVIASNVLPQEEVNGGNKCEKGVFTKTTTLLLKEFRKKTWRGVIASSLIKEEPPDTHSSSHIYSQKYFGQVSYHYSPPRLGAYPQAPTLGMLLAALFILPVFFVIWLIVLIISIPNWHYMKKHWTTNVISFEEIITIEAKSFGAFWSIWDVGAWRDLAHGRSSTGYAKEEGRSHLEDQLDRLLDQPVEFLNSTGQASTRSS